MPREATGTVFWRRGRWQVRVTMPDGTRPCFDLPVPLTRTQVATARRYALEMAEEVRAGNYRPKPSAPSGGETVGQWFVRWFAARRARGRASIATDHGRITKHVLPVLGDVPIATVRKVDIERVVASLDATVRAERLSWKTAHNTWGLIARAFKDACRSKDPSLRCREDNPCADVAPPDRGADKAKCYLFPSEFLALVSCETLPLASRRRYTLAVYLYARAGELAALSWDAIDLEHGTALLHEAIQRESGKRKATKTGETRRFAIEPELMPLLRAMHAESGGVGTVAGFVYKGGGHMARDLRLDLTAAGVTRPELFAKNATRVPLTFHDLRATGITWMAVRGDPALQIRHRAGHDEFKTTEGYIREGEAVRQGFGTVFPPLPKHLLCQTESSPRIVTGRGSDSKPIDTTTKSWWRRRESNPGPQAIGEDLYAT